MNGTIQDETITDDQIDQMLDILKRINNQLSGFRNQIIYGFVNRADKEMCANLCLARYRITLLLTSIEEGE